LSSLANLSKMVCLLEIYKDQNGSNFKVLSSALGHELLSCHLRESRSIIHPDTANLLFFHSSLEFSSQNPTLVNHDTCCVSVLSSGVMFLLHYPL
jgi:hypothetical protein